MYVKAKTVFRMFLLLCLTIAAQAQYHFDSWTTDNGLPQNSVNSIVQTADGYLWFTTLDGLVRFDGVRFTVLNKSNAQTLPSNRLTNLIIDHENALWIGLETGGLVRFRNGEFQTFTIADGLPSAYVFEIVKKPDGTILAFTTDGIAQFDGTRFLTYADERSRNFRRFKLYFAPSGTHWELNAETLEADRNGKKTVFDLPANLKKDFSLIDNLSYIVKLFEDREGTLWFWGGSDRLFKLKDRAIEEVKLGGKSVGVVQVIAQDAEGTIWLGSNRLGACRLTPHDLDCFDSKNGLTSNDVKDIFSDREGNLWIATNDKGLCRLTKQIVTPLSTAQGLVFNNIYSILESRDGAVWIGSFGAISKYQNGAITNYGAPEGLIYSFVQGLFEDRDGRLWIGGLNGVQYFENGRFYDFLPALNAKFGDFIVYAIHRDRRGILWFATTSGLIKYNGEKSERLTVSDGLPSDNVKTILETRDGALWLGTFGGVAEVRDGKITALTEQDGLAGNHIRTLYEDADGTLWIGTYESGLARLKNGKFTNYTRENGLFSNGVFAILPDTSGNFWMSSNQGVYRVSRQELNDFAEGRRSLITSVAFGKSDGMRSSEANGGGQPTGIRARDGRLWFPTQDGVAIFNPEIVPYNPLPPPVVIESLRIDNQTINNFQNGIEISPAQENLEIDYTGLSFIKPEQVRFRYRLEGLDENWTEAGSRRTAFFPYLAPGEYVFRVAAANSDNVWNETGASIKISKKPPFFRTWWFYTACTIGFGGIIYALYRRRVSRLERAQLVQEEFSRRLINAHETERRRIAAELHDSIGQSLAMIKNRVILSAETVTDENIKKQLELISLQTTQTIGEVREISYALRPYLLDNLGLTKAVKSLLNKITETSQLQIQSEIDAVDNLFEGEAEMSIYRMIQESLGNILKHAEATEAQVLMTKSERNLTILISDDGRGFDINAIKSGDEGKGGFGLLGIAERVKMLGGTREIESEVGGGTTILIKIPLSKTSNGDGKSN